MNKNILVTGHQGIIGSIILTRLRVMGYIVEGYDLKDGDDILDTDKLALRLEDKDACIHLAAIPAPTGDPWEEFERVNVNGTKSVIKACKKAKVKRLIYTSSGDVYGLCGQLTIPEQFPIKEENNSFKEKDKCFYARSKRMCEQHLKGVADENFTTIALRLETPHPPAPLLPSHFYISISPDNLAEAFRAALEADFKGYGVFNVADPEVHLSINIDIQQWIAQNWPDVENKTKGRESLLDISKARELLEYNPI